MTKNEFIQHLEAPHYINEEDTDGLKEVLKEFPYCESLQMLLTKAYHVSENLNFEGQLKKTAAYASDRKKLHELLFEKELPATAEKYTYNEILEEKQEAISEVIPVPIANPYIGNTIIEKEVIEAPTSEAAIEESKETLIETPEPVPVELESIVPAEPEQKNEESKEDIFPKKETKEETLEKQILSSAINSSILQEVSADLPDLSQIITKEQHPEEFAETESHSFNEWLSFFSDEPVEKNEAKEISLWDNASLDSKEGLKAFSQSTVPAKKEFYSAVKMAKLSVQEDDDLVTETLAIVYAEQQHFEKAIKAYEKLQLKYPEKRSYFADRIKEIKNQINT